MNEADVDAVVTACKSKDPDRVAQAGARLGLVLTLEGLDRVKALVGVLSFREVLVTMVQALEHPSGISLGERRKEFCLAVVHEGTITVGIPQKYRSARTFIHDWPELRPWFKELAKNRKRCIEWTGVEATDRVRFPVVAIERPKADASVGDLIAQLVDNPDDDDLRMVLADRLLERDDIRGELIRIGIQRKTSDTALLRERANEIERAHRKALAGDIAEVAADFRLQDGFVHSVTMTAGAFKKHGERIFRSQPIRHLDIAPWNDAAVRALAKTPFLSQISSLDCGVALRPQPSAALLEPLVGFRFERLESLGLLNAITTSDGGTKFFHTLDAPNLKMLSIIGGFLGAGVLRAIATNKSLVQNLERLTLVRLPEACGKYEIEPIADAFAAAVFDQVAFPKLRTLWLEKSWFLTDARVAKLVGRCPALESMIAHAPGPLTNAALEGRNIKLN